MAKPKSIELKTTEQQKVVSLFTGSKSRKAIKNARTIAKEIKASRYQVMAVLEKNKLAKYSAGSYN